MADQVTRARRRASTLPIPLAVERRARCVGCGRSGTAANADNLRLNQGVITNVDTIKKQAGCKTDLKLNLQLQAAAQRHADDMLNNHDLDGDVGTDGSTVQDRARAAGYSGKVAETVGYHRFAGDQRHRHHGQLVLPP